MWASPVTDFLLQAATIYTGFCVLDVVQRIPLSWLAIDFAIVGILLELARQSAEWFV